MIPAFSSWVLWATTLPITDLVYDAGKLCHFMFQEADLAITDLTITSEREAAVDFTTPFMSLGE
jgi:hypothetical protein